MSKQKLFVSFAESDGGHSYLAARAMLEPSSIAHLIFRTSVADSLEAVANGQANYAIVPAYNSITQWEGATLKALSSGGFEIFAQVCMPTSYVLVAHKDYMNEFVNAYLNLRDQNARPTPEEAAKIYTRFLTRIYVGAQAEEQYRGRLVRPDLAHATIELSRNPLRILEEITRTELVKAMTAAAPSARAYQPYPQQPLPQHVSGGTVGATQVLQPITQPAAVPIMDTLQAPAALVAAGLLDAPGDPEGWDQPGSLGEIVSLLRKLLVLLNVYSFGSPDLPENKTQYLLIGRRGAPVPDGVRAPAAAPTRIMAMVRPTLKRSSADQWMRPRKFLADEASRYGYVFDRPPLMISPGQGRVFLFEGGKPKDGVTPTPLGMWKRFENWMLTTFDPEGAKKASKNLRKSLDKKADAKLKDDTPEKYEVAYIGHYQTWCADPAAGATCWCCEEAHGTAGSDSDSFRQFLLFFGTLAAALFMFALVVFPLYCMMTGACGSWFGGSTPSYQTLPPPPQQGPPSSTAPTGPTPPSTTPRQSAPGYPGVPAQTNDKPPQAANPPAPSAAPPVKVETPPPLRAFHVAFFEGKANLTPEAVNTLADAAAQAMNMNKTATVKLVALGPRESESLWQRRVYAVKDELVRLSVPASRIRYEGTGAGPYVVTIRANQTLPSATRKRGTGDLDMVDDPMSPD